MQVFSGALNFDHEVGQPAQPVCDARLLLSEPVVVGYAHVIRSFQPRVFAGEKSYSEKSNILVSYR